MNNVNNMKSTYFVSMVKVTYRVRNVMVLYSNRRRPLGKTPSIVDVYKFDDDGNFQSKISVLNKDKAGTSKYSVIEVTARTPNECLRQMFLFLAEKVQDMSKDNFYIFYEEVSRMRMNIPIDEINDWSPTGSSFDSLKSEALFKYGNRN